MSRKKRRFFYIACAAVCITVLTPAAAQTSAPKTSGTLTAAAQQIPAAQQITAASADTKTRPSVALVLSGGGAKGFAHIPILEIIEELEIPIDIILGTSAGSIVGSLYCAGYSPREIMENLEDIEWAQLFKDRPVSSLEQMLGSRSTLSSPFQFKFGTNLALELGKGLSTGQHVYQLFKKLTVKIPSNIDFDTLPIPFRATATDLLSGQQVIFDSGDVAEAVRASMSIPGVFEPFQIDGRYYIDGGVSNNLPIQEARRLGYDIVIAVEISDKPIEREEVFESNPLMALTQMFMFTQAPRNEPHYSKADIVLFPDVARYSILDFPLSRRIYREGRIEAEKNRKKLIELRKKIYPNQYSKEKETDTAVSKAVEPDIDGRKLFVPADTQRVTPPAHRSERDVYKKLPPLAVTELVIHGAVESDEKFIDSLFTKMFTGSSALTGTDVDAFIEAVYRTGNYTSITSRLYTHTQPAFLELTMIPVKRENALLLISGYYQGSIAADSQSKLVLSTDIQYRGITGPGSALSVKFDFVNTFAADILYFQPVGPKTYLELNAEIRTDQTYRTAGFDDREISGTRLNYTRAGGLFGIRFNSRHQMAAGAYIDWFDSSKSRTSSIIAVEAEYPDVKADTGADIFARYIFSTLDYQSFPTRGFFVEADNTGTFPLRGENTPIAFNIFCADFTAALPVAPRFSIIVNMFAGTDMTQQLAKTPSMIPVYGFSLDDRRFFPQIAGKDAFGTHKAAASFGLQFQPWGNLTILGGQMFFIVSGAAGNTWMKYTDITLEGIQWNASVSCGIRIKDTFSIIVRTGAGSSCDKITPYFSLDFGAFRY